jgi:hypothetical protein
LATAVRPVNGPHRADRFASLGTHAARVGPRSFYVAAPFRIRAGLFFGFQSSLQSALRIHDRVTRPWDGTSTSRSFRWCVNPTFAGSCCYDTCDYLVSQAVFCCFFFVITLGPE